MADLDFRPDVYQIKQPNSVLVADSDATMAGGYLIGFPDRAFPWRD